jgi:hypothetical protein
MVNGYRDYMVVFGQCARLDPDWQEEPFDKEEWEAHNSIWRGETMQRLSSICENLKEEHRARNRAAAKAHDVPAGSEDMAW